MDTPRKTARTHSRKELAAPKPPILLGVLVTLSAIMAFVMLMQVLS